MKTHLLGALFMAACGLFGFALESLSAPAACVAIGFLIIVAAWISMHWDVIR
jgi:hypothetical protein